MPIPSQFEEELVFEWMLLKGYSAEVNIRIGKDELDVVGYRITKDGVLEILHVEVGVASGSIDEEVKNLIEKKFSKEKRDKLRKIICRKLSLNDNVKIDYTPMFIRTSPSNENRWRQKLAEKNIKFMSIKEFIKNEVLKTIEEWKKMQKKARLC